MRRPFWLLLLLAVALPAALAACGGDDDEADDGKVEVDNSAVGDGLVGVHHDFKGTGKLKVATTVAPITSIVLNIGGNRVFIHGLIPNGVNSHTYEPRPSDAAVLSRADIFIMNGAALEGTSEEIAKKNLKDPKKIYKLADNTLQGDDPKTGFLYDFSFPRAEGKPNPHLWMNPKYALRYAELVRDWLSENDPKNADYFKQNFEAFAKVINQLDEAIKADQATVPAQNRKLLTYHDSWAYWAREYGWSVVGAIQPSDFGEPSAKDVADLIKQIRDEKVPAIFGSEVFPSKVLETIAKESGAAFEDQLSDDDPPFETNDKRHTFVGMVIEDMRIMFGRLGGKADTVSKVPAENTFAR
ncbi:MAG: metal ABC transporter substrate-binding protein [Dehalococcoidia bacterium]